MRAWEEGEGGLARGEGRAHLVLKCCSPFPGEKTPSEDNPGGGKQLISSFSQFLQASHREHIELVLDLILSYFTDMHLKEYLFYCIY